MPSRKKRSKKTNTSTVIESCQWCDKDVSNWGRHFQHNPNCFEHYNSNTSFVASTKHHNTSEMKQKVNNLSEINRDNYDFAHGNDLDYNLFENLNHSENVFNNSKKRSSNTNIDTKNDSETNIRKKKVISIDNNNGEEDSIRSSSSNNSQVNEHNISYNASSASSRVTVDKVVTNTTDSTISINLMEKIDKLMSELDPQEQQTNENLSSTSSKPNALFDFSKIQSKFKQQLMHLPIDNITVSCVHLLKIMNDGHIPSTHYSNIIKWYENTFVMVTNQLEIDSSVPCLIKSRKQIINLLNKVLFESISNNLSLKPIHNIIRLPSTRTAKISKFDIITSIFTLLTDTELMVDENLLLNDTSFTNPNSDLSNESKLISDFHHGSAFKRAHKKLCTHPIDILIPIIPFIDGTPIDPYGRNKLEVVMFTLGLFKQSTRNKTSCWRLLGYLPDPCHESSGQNDYNESSSRNNAISKRMDYHHMLKFILSDLVSLEQSEGLLWDIFDKNGKKTKSYRFKFTVLFIIGDAVGNDKLCDRYASYGKKVKRLCRDCDCPTQELDKHDHICNFTKRSDIQLKNDAQLKDISYYKIDNNVFDEFNFGFNPLGLNGCLPPETLHQLNQGVFKKLLDFFDDCITSKGNEMIDSIVRYLAMNFYRQSNKEFPKIHIFKDGLNKCQLTGTEIVFKIFILYLAMIQTYTLEQLPLIENNVSQRYKKKKNVVIGGENDNVEEDKHFYPKIGRSLDTMLEWVKLLEFTLCLDAWVNKSSYEKEETSNYDNNGNYKESKGQISMRTYMKLYTRLIKDPVGNGTLTSKIHWLLHITFNIERFGPPKVYSGQTPERCLSPLVKWAARRTQLRPSTIIEQSSERYYENVLINRAVDILQHQNILDSKPTTPQYINNLKHDADLSQNKRAYLPVGRYTMFIDPISKTIKKIEWKTKRSSDKKLSLNNKLIRDVIEKLFQPDMLLQCDEINCFTSLYISH